MSWRGMACEFDSGPSPPPFTMLKALRVRDRRDSNDSLVVERDGAESYSKLVDESMI